MKKIVVFVLLFFNFLFALNVTNKCGIFPSQVKYPYFPKIFLYTNNVPFDFKCPSLQEIKSNPQKYKSLQNLLKTIDINKVNPTIFLDNINFLTGSYSCVYHINDVSFKIYLNNNYCKNFRRDFNTLFPLNKVNSMAKLDVPNIVTDKIGFYNFDKPVDFKEIYNTLYNSALQLIVKIKEIIAGNQINIIDLKSLDSHSNYNKTVPAFLINLLTLSPDYSKDGQLVDSFGNLNMNFPKESLKNMKMLLNLTNQNVETGTTFNNAEEISNFIMNKNKMFNEKFWGFYYIFFKNIEIGFNQIISIIFLFGAFGVFGFALMQKKFDLYLIEESQKFQFDFSKKFLSLAIPYILFTAPIITSSSAKIPNQFLYQSQSENNINMFTPIQLAIRYSLNFGNYFGNLINDYGTYAYLNYLTTITGYNLNPQSVLKQLNKDYTDFYYKFYRLKQKYDFYRTMCVLSYPNIFKKYGHFPSNIKYYQFDNFNLNNINSPQYQLWSTFHFSQVNYNYCVFLENDIYARSLDLINSLNNYKTDYLKNIKDTQLRISKNVYNNLTDFLKTYISINNTFGWLTSSVLPSLETLLKANNFIASIDVNQLKNQINKELIKYSDYSYTDINNNNLNEKYKTENQSGNEVLQLIKEKFATFSIYTILPGFNDLFKNVKEAIYNFGTKATSLFSKIISFTIPDIIKTSILFFISFVISIILYNLLVSILTFMLITMFIIIKIAFYYLEIFVTFLISFALSIWALTINPQKAWEAWNNFIFHVAKLTFMPIILVLTSFSIILINKLIKYIYAFILYIMGTIFSSSSDLIYSNNVNNLINSLSNFELFKSGNNFIQFFETFLNYFSVNAFINGSGGIILDIIILLIDIIIIFKFSDWVFEIFGKKTGGDMITGEIRQIGEGMKAKYAGGML